MLNTEKVLWTTEIEISSVYLRS